MNQILSEPEREKRAQQAYESARHRIIFWLLAGGAVWAVIVNWLGIAGLACQILSLAAIFAVCFLLDARAKISIYRAGLPTRSRSKIEIAQRAPITSSGQWKEVNWVFDTVIHAIVNISFFVVGNVLIAILINQLFEARTRPFDANFFWYIVGACCIVFIPWYFLKYKSSTVRIDARGVFGYAFCFFPCLVSWKHIEQVYVRRVRHPLTGKEDLTLLLKNAEGKTVLALGGIAFKAISRKKSNQIVAEINRYFYGNA